MVGFGLCALSEGAPSACGKGEGAVGLCICCLSPWGMGCKQQVALGCAAGAGIAYAEHPSISVAPADPIPWDCHGDEHLMPASTKQGPEMTP